MKYGNTGKPTTHLILRSPFVLIGALILVVILIRATWNIHEKSLVSLTKLEEAQTELTKLKDRQNDLSAKVGELSSDGGIEAEIRTKFRAVKEGESVAVILDSTNATDSTAAAGNATTTAVRAASWWQRVLHALGILK